MDCLYLGDFLFFVFFDYELYFFNWFLFFYFSIYNECCFFEDCDGICLIDLWYGNWIGMIINVIYCILLNCFLIRKFFKFNIFCIYFRNEGLFRLLFFLFE